MKKFILFISVLGVLASCSSPKYAYHFDTYDYNSSAKQKPVNPDVHSQPGQVVAAPDQQTLTATISEDLYSISEFSETPAIPENDAAATYANLSKAEKKEFRKETVKAVKEYVKAVKSGDSDKANEMAKAMDSNLRWAAIFGVIGFAGLLIGGDVFGLIGGIAIIIAAVFLVLYFVNK